ncbi:hypothetical protein [Arcicella aurantiaca]|uniref:hypothetical protein n=1 Tax=Arcicella aurantiaca TaxID=591202 RepID=UPI0011B24029|nr:hypothetical protein [Arcicella aurantiaca]
MANSIRRNTKMTNAIRHYQSTKQAQHHSPPNKPKWRMLFATTNLQNRYNIIALQINQSDECYSPLPIFKTGTTSSPFKYTKMANTIRHYQSTKQVQHHSPPN